MKFMLSSEDAKHLLKSVGFTALVETNFEYVSLSAIILAVNLIIVINKMLRKYVGPNYFITQVLDKAKAMYKHESVAYKGAFLVSAR